MTPLVCDQGKLEKFWQRFGTHLKNENWSCWSELKGDYPLDPLSLLEKGHANIGNLVLIYQGGKNISLRSPNVLGNVFCSSQIERSSKTRKGLFTFTSSQVMNLLIRYLFGFFDICLQH